MAPDPELKLVLYISYVVDLIGYCVLVRKPKLLSDDRFCESYIFCIPIKWLGNLLKHNYLWCDIFLSMSKVAVNKNYKITEVGAKHIV